jgi:hypothetical protein
VSASTTAPSRARWRARLDDALFGPEPAARLRAVRIGLAAVICWRLAVGPFHELADQPRALFQPVWFLSPLDGMPPVGVLVVLQAAGLVAGLAVLVGRAPRAAFVVAWACLLVLGGLHGSRGKVQHNELLLLFAAVPILFAPAPARAEGSTRSWRFGWPVRSAIATISAIYFLTGVQKVVHSGPGWVLGDNMRNVLYRAVLGGKGKAEGLSLFVADHAWLSHAVAGVALGAELLFPLVLLVPKVRPVALVTMVGMHLMIYLTHGLDYSAWALTVVVLLVDWPACRARRGVGTVPPAALRWSRGSRSESGADPQP